MKGQASSEFLVIVAVLSFMMVPFLLLVYMNSAGAPEKIAISKASFSAARLASSANAVGAMGIGARLYTTIEVPDVQSVQASGNEVVVTLKTSYGEVNIVQPTRHPVLGVGLDYIKGGGTYTVDVVGPESYSSPQIVRIILR